MNKLLFTLTLFFLTLFGCDDKTVGDFCDGRFAYLYMDNCEADVERIEIAQEELIRLHEIIKNANESCVFASVNPLNSSTPVEGYLKKIIGLCYVSFE